ncbi:MAG: hypothetical protein QM817_26740 [Archangium sp.]
MSALFKKLNLGEHTQVSVIDAPKSFDAELTQLKGVTIARAPKKGFAFVIGFGTTKKQVDAFAKKVAAPLEGDPVVWFAYPKGSSKKYTCEFNRNDGWDALGAVGYEPVRQVAIDEDWSALRFRRVGNIKTLTRAASGARTAEGKRRTTGKGR